MKDEFVEDGRVQTAKLNTIGRIGGDLYCRLNDIFEMKMPTG